MPTVGASTALTVALLLAGCSTSPGADGARHASSTTRSHAGHSHRAHSNHTHPAKPSPTASPKPTGSRLRPKGPVSRGWRVYDVVDGDTVKVTRGQRELTLRLIGIDTPEVVDPFAPVECYVPAASANAHRRLDGRRVRLEFDRSQGRLDKYGRTLAYLWVVRDGGPWLYNQAAVHQGFAKEYTYDTPYAWRSSFLRAQSSARRHRRGLWSPRTCDGNTTQPAHAAGETGGAGTGSGRCAPGYSPCLPVVADLDCADIGHPVTVTGADQYGLDSDGNGIGCESS